MLLVARLLLGLTIGVSVVVVPVFVAESAPAKVRGSLLVAYQVATVVGIIIGYLAAYLLAGTGNWRWMLGLAAVPAALVMLMLLRLPDTARWYMMKGRAAEARRVLQQVEPAADVDRTRRDQPRTAPRRAAAAIREMLRKPYLRATIFVVGLGFFIQITGINAIVYYSPRLFEAMGFEGNFALLVLPALVQVAALVAVFVSLVLVDRLGRRPILLTGIAMMIAANALLIGVFTAGTDFGGALTTLGFLGVLLFTVGFTFGFGALVWVYAGESFPSRLRSLGSSAMLTSDLVANAIVAAFFLTMLNSLGGAGTFAVFGIARGGRVRLRLPVSPRRPRAASWKTSGTSGRTAAGGPRTDDHRRSRATAVTAGVVLGLDIGGSKTHGRCGPRTGSSSRRWPAAPTWPRSAPARRDGSWMPSWSGWAPMIVAPCARARPAWTPRLARPSCGTCSPSACPTRGSGWCTTVN